jgi:hypothetical protein
MASKFDADFLYKIIPISGKFASSWFRWAVLQTELQFSARTPSYKGYVQS